MKLDRYTVHDFVDRLVSRLEGKRQQDPRTRPRRRPVPSAREALRRWVREKLELPR